MKSISKFPTFQKLRFTPRTASENQNLIKGNKKQAASDNI